MGIAAGLLRHLILIIPDGKNHRATDLSNYQPPAETRKAHISDETEDIDTLSGFGKTTGGMILATVRKDSFTKLIDDEYHVLFDNNRYRVTKSSPRFDRDFNLIDLRMERV